MAAHRVLYLAVIVAMALGAAAHRHNRRDLQGQGGNPTGNGIGKGANNGQRNRDDGKMFDFSTVGGAASFLAQMDSEKLQRVMEKAGWTKGIGGLAKQLTEDPDFVSSNCSEPPLDACRARSVVSRDLFYAHITNRPDSSVGNALC